MLFGSCGSVRRHDVYCELVVLTVELVVEGRIVSYLNVVASLLEVKHTYHCERSLVVKRLLVGSSALRINENLVYDMSVLCLSLGPDNVVFDLVSADTEQYVAVLGNRSENV